MNLYAIFDSKSQTYEPLLLPFPSDAEAVRYFDLLSLSADSKISKYPEDYTLFCLGDFSLVTASLTPLEHPRHVVSAEDRIIYYEVLRKRRSDKVNAAMESSKDE